MPTRLVPRQSSLILPEIQNPFVHKIHLTQAQKIQVNTKFWQLHKCLALNCRVAGYNRKKYRNFIFKDKLWLAFCGAILLFSRENYKFSSIRYKWTLFFLFFEQVALMTVFVFPIRLIGIIVCLLIAWLIAKIALLGRTEEDLKEPLSGWRK